MRRPQIRGPPHFSIPGMHQLVRQQRTTGRGVIPLAEVAALYAILTRSVMLEADAREMVADRQKKVVVIERLRPEQRKSLPHQPPVRFDVLRLRGQLVGRLRDDIQAHRYFRSRIEIDLLEVPPCE